MFKFRTRLIRWLAGDDMSVCIGITAVPKGIVSRRKYTLSVDCTFIRTSFTNIHDGSSSGMGGLITEDDIRAASRA